MDQAAGIIITIPRAVVADIIMEKLSGIGIEPPRRMFGQTGQRALPAIGEAFEGGIYAGLTIHDNAPHALILLPEEKESVNWNAATTWARDNTRGGLPSRFDALVLFTNLKREFKPEYYWTNSPDASDESYAWLQGFGSGYQFTYLKDYGFRARAVRRVGI